VAVILFALLVLVTLGSAIGVVLTTNIVRSAVWLLLTLVGVSLTYFLLGAEFLGAAQLIVYVGGTLVLVVFGVMLTSAGPSAQYMPTKIDWYLAFPLGLLLFAMLVLVSIGFDRRSTPTEALPETGSIGLAFLGINEAQQTSAYLLPFEILSVHLLVVLIAAAYLARAKRPRIQGENRG
jgi:NADH-quinone oxidoreductase subunit J